MNPYLTYKLTILAIMIIVILIVFIGSYLSGFSWIRFKDKFDITKKN